ncbi:hypothetical protein AFERRI_400264 [Acidithiobacillus ferrivorans]|uniref:Uncharacterized protein n=1 Tax=Acidithiobacillus ferrivorans TaxID=160808 RepID=A0A060UUS6_9PROT|nr:hypothetical protein AFERRI_400264 [Acidithiobacillus ferrivorans]
MLANFAAKASDGMLAQRPLF